VHSDTPACRSRSRRATWLCEVSFLELALRFRQRPGLDQQALSFIAVSTPAEANHHGVPWTFRLGSTREQRISGGQEFKITETGVSRACRARIFHVRWVDASGKGYALPEIFLRNFPVPIRCSRSILTRPRVLSLIAPVANISFIGVQ
jgi:hypothetical protein